MPERINTLNPVCPLNPAGPNLGPKKFWFAILLDISLPSNMIRNEFCMPACIIRFKGSYTATTGRRAKRYIYLA